MREARTPGEWREAVARTAAGLIVEGGLGAVTVRAIARELGCSTMIVSHHFRNKDEVLLETYRHVVGQAYAARQRLLDAGGVDPLATIESLLPLAAPQRRWWTVWIHYWTAALHNPDLAREHAAGLQRMFDQIQAYLLSAGVAGAEAPAGAQGICNALYGIAIQAIFDTGRWDAERQRAEFQRAVAQVMHEA